MKNLINRIKKYFAKGNTTLPQHQIDFYYYQLDAGFGDMKLFPKKSYKFYPICLTCGKNSKNEDFSVILAPKDETVLFFCSPVCLYNYNVYPEDQSSAGAA
jgi:hypothetical protein